MQCGHLVFTVLAAAVLSCAASTRAATYSYTGAVEVCPDNVIPCANGSLSVGDDLLGFVDIADPVIQPDSSFSYTAITDYSFAAGFFTLTPDNTDLVAGFFETDSLGELAGGFLHVYAPVDTLPNGNPVTVLTFDLVTSSWSLLATTAPNPEWPFVVALGSGSFSSAVPAPAAILLFVPALALLGLAWRRDASAS